jgi:Protein of unknown function (DUF1264)
MDHLVIIALTWNNRRRIAVRLLSHIMAGLVVPALVAGIAVLAFVAMTAERSWPARTNVRANGEIDAIEPGLVYSPELGILPDERHRSHRREVKAPIAEILQCPLAFAAVHLMKDRPEVARVAYHFCKPINDDVSQCILYDGTGPDARLIGIEYLVTDAIYNKMPPEEQAYWHDYKYEIDSGLLKSLTQSGADEEASLAKIRTLRAKVFYTWMSGGDYPEGPAQLFWSVTGKVPFVLPHDVKLAPEFEAARAATGDKR